MNKKLQGLLFVASLFLLVFVSISNNASASTLTQGQIDSIVGLLQAFNADRSVINQVTTTLGGRTTAAPPPSAAGDSPDVLYNRTTGTSASGMYWRSVTSSSDGTKLAAVGNPSTGGGDIWISNDSGTTWVKRGPTGNHIWYSISSSADGTKLVAADTYPGGIYASTDSGTTWTAIGGANSGWYAVTISADGTKIAASGNSGVYTTNDWGATWSNRTPPRGPAGTISVFTYVGLITGSADGQTLAAVADVSSNLYVSTDQGRTWSVRTPANNLNIRSVALSADGTKLAAVAESSQTNGSKVYTSSDVGVSWTDRTSQVDTEHTLSSVASSADGSRLVVVPNNYYTNNRTSNSDKFWVSSDSGVHWRNVPIPTYTSMGNTAMSSDGMKIAMLAYPSGDIWTIRLPGSAPSTNTNPQTCGAGQAGTPPNCVTITTTNTSNTQLSATLSVNGGSAASVVVGDPVNYVWSSTGAVSAASTYTVDSTGCGVTSTGPLPWVANTLQGSNSATAIDCQGGHSYVVTYTATNAAGRSVSTSVRVNIVSNCSATFNGFCIPGSPLLPQGTRTSTVTNGPTTQYAAIAVPTGTISTIRKSCLNATTCYISADWSAADTMRDGALASDLGIVISSDNTPVGGTWTSGRNYLITNTPQSSMTFTVAPGNYNLILWGWNTAGEQVELDRELVSVSASTGDTTIPAPTTSTSPRPTIQPTGTLSVTGCAAANSTATCGVVVTWNNVQNSYYNNTPFAVLNVIDAATNLFYRGSAVSGTSFYQTPLASGSYTFQLSPGTYNIPLYGWYNGAYSLMDLKQVVVTNQSSAGATAAIVALGGANQTLALNDRVKTRLTHTLMRGMSGADVTALQLFLVKKGYLKAPATGYFGPVTEAALKVYQKEHAIEQTGVAGSATAASIATQ